MLSGAGDLLNSGGGKAQSKQGKKSFCTCRVSLSFFVRESGLSGDSLIIWSALSCISGSLCRRDRLLKLTLYFFGMFILKFTENHDSVNNDIQ